MELRAQLLLLDLRLIAIANDALAYVLRLAEPLVQAVLVGAQSSLRGYEGSRERLLILQVDILVRGIRVRYVAGERVGGALREERGAHGLLISEDRILDVYHSRLRIDRGNNQVCTFKREFVCITKRGIEHELQHKVATTH